VRGGLLSTGRLGVLHHPISLAVALSAGALLFAAGIAHLSRAVRGNREAGLLATAMFVFSLVRLRYLAIPVAAPSWVTPAEGMRLLGIGLILAIALRGYARMRGEATREAARVERERIARDLHDGLAQDLAFIAAHAQRLQSDLGPEHPLAIAARRALAASRGAIVDVSAAAAPTTYAALRQVADELEERFGVEARRGAGASRPPA
jgi:signal transduction histidine kinase